MKEIACNIDKILEEKGMKVKELVAESGMGQTAIYNVRHGRSLPVLDNAVKISKILGKNLEEIWPDVF